MQSTTLLLVCLILVLVLVYPSFAFDACRVNVKEASKSYPTTLFRTLFSSVPKREFALKNVSFSAESELVVLRGASSSGKTALLKLIQGTENPTSGLVIIQRDSDHTAAQPILLDQKPRYDDSQTVEEILQSIVRNKGQVGSDCLEQVCQAVGFRETDLEKRPSQLSPSESYRYGSARACLESILPALSDHDEDSALPGPILLLDEWMDFETSSTVHRVEAALINLTKCGACILWATHKPQLLAKSHRTITLSRGEILSEVSA